MKLVVITTVWGRVEIANMMLSHLAEQRERLQGCDIALEILVCGSEGKASQDLAESHGAYYIEYENQPLGAKWNATVRAAQDLDPDAVMVLGSDNFCNDALFRAWATGVETAEYQGILDGYQYHVASGTLIHWHGYRSAHRTGEPLGSARCFSRSLLERTNWTLWDGSLVGSLDYSTTRLFEDLQPSTRIIRLADVDGRHLGLKTTCSMSPALINVTHLPMDHLLPESLRSWYGEAGARILELAPVELNETAGVAVVGTP